MQKYVFYTLLVLFIFTLPSFQVIQGTTAAKTGTQSFEPTTIPPSMTLLAGGARWAAQRGNSTLFVDWEDNYIAHGSTDGISWGPWPPEIDMQNWTNSIVYMLNTSGLDVHLAGDMPSDLTGYDLIVIHAYWACEPSQLAMIRDFIDNGGGVVLLAGVPEYLRCYCRDWWTYLCPTDDASIDMEQILGCDGNYANTGGYANVTVDNPFGSTLLTGDTLIEGAGQSNAAVFDPYEGSQVIATWEYGPAFAYTYEYGQGRVYYQAAFVALDPPARAPADVNGDNIVNVFDVVAITGRYMVVKGDQRYSLNADADGNGVINMLDVVICTGHYGERY